jgi:cytochrome c-type protein NapC
MPNNLNPVSSLPKYNTGYTKIGAIFLVIAGMLIWAGFNWTIAITNTDDFCISCHEMESFVYQDYRETVHYNNRTGIQATCSDCHVPKPWHLKMVRKIEATSDLYHELLGTIDSREKYEARKHQMAQAVWKSMKQNNSSECRNCHDLNRMDPGKQSAAAAKQHTNALKQDKTCIDCHKGVAHPLSEKFMESEHEEYINNDEDCEQCHIDM